MSFFKIITYFMGSLFLLSFIHCTNVDDASSLNRSPMDDIGVKDVEIEDIKDEDIDNEPIVNVEESTIIEKNVINYKLAGCKSAEFSNIKLTWRNPQNPNFFKVLILRSTSLISDAPTIGRDYANGDSIGSSTVVYNSDIPIFIDTNIMKDTVYYYRLFAYDTDFNYASGYRIAGRRAADLNSDGLIDICNATMFDNMRYDLAGTSYKTSIDADGDSSGCPSDGCHGYELMNNIDLLSLLDANENGSIDIDTTMEGIDKNADGDTTDAGEQITIIDIGENKDRSWVPIGDNLTDDDTSRFTGTFEGNNYIIANLWVNITPSSVNAKVYAGLFGVTGGVSAEIRNTRIASGSIFSSSSSSNSSSGGLVGSSFSSVVIENSYFSGSGGVYSSSSSSNSSSGGLVGSSSSSAVIRNSYFSGSGGVYSSSFSGGSSSGGLVGSSSSAVIENSYFSGFGGVYSSSSSVTKNSYSGGLVGKASSSLTITRCYFSGFGGVYSSSSSGNSYSGGLVGNTIDDLIITDSYFSSFGGVYSSSLYAPSYSGGLVGNTIDDLIITDSYFSGSGEVSSSSSGNNSSSGGLVGGSSTGLLTIINSYFNSFGGVSSSSSSSGDDSYSGGLAGFTSSSVVITNSYFSGLGRIFSSSPSGDSYSGGLLGSSAALLTITNSYFSGSGRISSSSSGDSYSGGLLGSSTALLTITNSYFSGSGGVYSSSVTKNSYSGGLVGKASSSLTITRCYFSGFGGVSSSSSSSVSSYSGALVGFSSSTLTATVTNFYWNKEVPQILNNFNRMIVNKRVQGNAGGTPVGAVSLTLNQLKAITGTYRTHPLNLLNGGGVALTQEAWDLGTRSQLPAIRKCIPVVTNGVANWATCASYGDLLMGQQQENLLLPGDGDGFGVDIDGDGFGVDIDGDGLIEISTASMLNNIRFNLAGSSYKISEEDNPGDSTGCPPTNPQTNPPTYSCRGYELTADIDLLNLLDTNKNGSIDTIRKVLLDKNKDGDKSDDGEYVDVIDTSQDTSWVPIGNSNTPFTGIFDGNSHTIANLWINSPAESVGLFGLTDGINGNVQIKNIGVSGLVFATGAEDAGGLVGRVMGSKWPGRGLVIINSYFSGLGGVLIWAPNTYSVKVGGLVGRVGDKENRGWRNQSPGASLIIINSYFSADRGVFAHGIGDISGGHNVRRTGIAAGGLVGWGRVRSSITIEDSYFSGSGNIITSLSSGTESFAGGLVGKASGYPTSGSYFIVKRSYFAGEGETIAKTSNPIIASSDGMISIFENNYWNKPASGGSDDDLGKVATSLTLEQLKATSGTYPSDLPNSTAENITSWDLGTTSQLPAINRCVNPTIGLLETPPPPPLTTPVPPPTSVYQDPEEEEVIPLFTSSITVVCESYDALLGGQQR